MIEHSIIERIDWAKAILAKGEYENCVFKNCSFYNADLSAYVFRGCKFEACDFSLAMVKNTTLNDVAFVNCKLLGVQFKDCNTFLLSFGFENCVLNFAVFYKLKLKKIQFKNCDLREADFTEADLSNSIFENCDLQRAVFYNAILERADFRSAYNYSFDPERNRIKKARFSQQGALGLLDKYNIVIE